MARVKLIDAKLITRIDTQDINLCHNLSLPILAHWTDSYAETRDDNSLRRHQEKPSEQLFWKSRRGQRMSHVNSFHKNLDLSPGLTY